MKKESLSLTMSKLILVISFIIGIGAVLGVLGYFLTRPKTEPVDFALTKKELKISCEISADCEKYNACTEIVCANKDIDNEKMIAEVLRKCGADISLYDPPGAFSNCECINNKCEHTGKTNCAKEGEMINYPAGTNKDLPDECCEGLKGLSGYAIENDKCEPFIGGPFLTCMPCGNGKCESISNFNEDKCNCPEDCGEEIDTSDWQTYRNEEYGFEVKYPLDFEEQKPESDAILLEATKTDRGSSYYLSIYVMSNYKIDQIVSKVAEAEEIVVGDHSGYKYFYIEGAGMSEVALIQAGQDALSISFDSIGNGQNFATANDRKVYIQDFLGQILSTFKFIEK